MTLILSSGPLTALIFMAAAPVLPRLATHFDGEQAEMLAQLVMTMPGLGIVFGAPLAGWLIDRLGIRAVLLSCLMLYAVCGSAGLYLNDALPFLLARFGLGLAAAGLSTASTLLISERFDGTERARVLGYMGATGAAFGVLSLLTAGAVAELSSWRAPFALYLVAVPLLVTAAAFLAPIHRSSVEDRPATWAPLLTLWPIYLMIVPLFAAAFMTSVQGPFLLAANGVASPAVQSWVLASSAVMNAIAASSYGRIRTQIGQQPTFVVILALMGAGNLVVGLSHDPIAVAAGCGLAGAGAGLLGPYLTELVLDRAPPAVRGRAIGLKYAAYFIGQFCNPIIIAPLRAAVAIHGAFTVVGMALGAAALVALMVRTRRAEDPAI